MALPPAAGLRIAVGLAVVGGSALRRCSVAGGAVAVGLSAALAAGHRTAMDFEAVVAGAVAVVVGLCREAVVRLLQCRACTPRIVRRRRQRRFPLSDASVVRPTAVAAAVAVAAVTTCSRAFRDHDGFTLSLWWIAKQLRPGPGVTAFCFPVVPFSMAMSFSVRATPSTLRQVYPAASQSSTLKPQASIHSLRRTSSRGTTTRGGSATGRRAGMHIQHADGLHTRMPPLRL